MECFVLLVTTNVVVLVKTGNMLQYKIHFPIFLFVLCYLTLIFISFGEGQKGSVNRTKMEHSAHTVQNNPSEFTYKIIFCYIFDIIYFLFWFILIKYTIILIQYCFEHFCGSLSIEFASHFLFLTTANTSRLNSETIYFDKKKIVLTQVKVQNMFTEFTTNIVITNTY